MLIINFGFHSFHWPVNFLLLDDVKLSLATSLLVYSFHACSKSLTHFPQRFCFHFLFRETCVEVICNSYWLTVMKKIVCTENCKNSTDMTIPRQLIRISYCIFSYIRLSERSYTRIKTKTNNRT